MAPLHTNTKDTVSMHFAAAAVARLAPAPRTRVLAEAGIPEALLAVPSARLPAAHFAALWLAVARAIDDEFFALDSRRMKPGSFALVARAALGAGTLGRALKTVLRGFAVLLDDVEGRLEVQGDAAAVVVANRIADAAARRFADETFLVLVHGLVGWLGGRRIAIARTRFAHPRPAHAAEHALMFSRRVEYDAPATAIEFDAAALAAPVVQDDRALAAFLRTAPQSVFVRCRDELSWTARVRRALRDAGEGGDWPALAEVARRLRLAEPTLRRRLEDEGTSWQRIKDGLRRDAAVHRLCHTRDSIAEIGRALGFQEPSAFHKAFRKWTGARPGEYRRGQGTGSAATGQTPSALSA